MGEKIKRYACFTDLEQEAYENLAPKQRLYIDFRAQGFGKRESYEMAGYMGKYTRQAAVTMEQRNPVIVELVNILQKQKQVDEIAESGKEAENSELNRKIDALARRENVEHAIEKIEGPDSETAKRVQFYRDIIMGKIKTVTVTKEYDGEGKLIKRKVVEQNDVNVRMQARMQLDRILGMNTIVNLDKLKVGQITVNIVDASNTEELSDSRNDVDLRLDEDKYEILDGEPCIVVEEHIKGKPADSATSEG